MQSFKFALLLILAAPGCAPSTDGGGVTTVAAEADRAAGESGATVPVSVTGTVAAVAGAAAGTVAPSAASGDWPWWRGPNRNGIADEQADLPVSWNQNQNVVWKTPVPGRGHASPTVVGQRIFLATADEERQVQSVVAFDRETGQQLWKTDVNRGGLPGRIHQKNTHASRTVACDGQRVYASFNNRDSVQLTALDLEGNQIWQKTVGKFRPQQYQYGYAPSPTLYHSAVIVCGDYDGGGFLAALDRESGETIWKIERPGKLSYSSPIITNIAGRDQLFLSGCDQVASYDPTNGKMLWSAPGTTMATCGTMVWDGELVFASGGYPKAETICVRADGSRNVVWKNNQKCYEQSMLAHEGYIYAVNDQGIAFCWRADDGREMWKMRLGGSISASPILAGGNIYQSNERGTTYVFKAEPAKFTAVAQNQLGDEAFATPTICGGRIYLRVADSSSGRRQETLYCIGKQ